MLVTLSEAALQILELDIQFAEAGEALLDAGEVLDPFIDELTAGIGTARQQLPKSLVQLLDALAVTVQLVQPEAELGEQFPRFLNGVVLFELVIHVSARGAVRRIGRSLDGR